MDDLRVFSYNGDQVRTVQWDGETWWVLKDVCGVLGLTTPARVSERLFQDDVSQTHIIDSLGRRQETTIINESGLYEVIIRSDKAEAKNFRRWVTREVLPSIRKYGAYMTEVTADRILDDPDFGIQLLSKLKEERQRNIALTAKNEDMAVRLNESDRFWTIMKFNRHFHMGWDMAACQRNGKKASAYSRQHGYEIRKCQTNDDRFGETNSYAYEVLEALFLHNRQLRIDSWGNGLF